MHMERVLEGSLTVITGTSREVNAALRESVGAATQLPTDWVVNEKKIACLLRCADAAHIDHRRAPSMLYALSKPKGDSDKHWRFQHKLNKVTRVSDALVFSSGQDFNLEEAPAWWLCFDVVKMIDRELSLSNALLQDIGVHSFAASRVYGVESPRILAGQIRPNGWQPVDAEIRVTDPAQLARTLGGRNLYGQSAYAPIRELLQNAVDAIRARRKLEGRSRDWGRIKLTLETARPRSVDENWLHIDDTGVGMSERVLVGPLLDFGRSLWNSPLMQEEFPGLESRGIKPIGKYGIGFFSIFMLGERVNVISRPYKAGLEATRVLEFSSLSSRPILRNAKDGELPTDFTTRISVRIADLGAFEESDDPYFLYVYRRRGPYTIHKILSERVRHLISAVDVRIELEDRVSRAGFLHEPDWINSPAELFLEENLAAISDEERRVITTAHQHLLSVVETPSGECVGRAALWMFSEGNFRFRDLPNSVSVGGFVYPGASEFEYVGVLAGDTVEVRRGTAVRDVPKQLLAKWATNQARLIEAEKFQIADLMGHATRSSSWGVIPWASRSAFVAEVSLHFLNLKRLVSAKSSIYVPVDRTYDDNLKFVRISELGTIVFTHTPVQQLIAIHLGRQRDLLSRELARSIVEDGSQGRSYD